MRMNNYMPSKVWEMKLLIHSQASMSEQLKFGNGSVILSTLCNGCNYLSSGVQLTLSFHRTNKGRAFRSEVNTKLWWQSTLSHQCKLHAFTSLTRIEPSTDSPKSTKLTIIHQIAHSKGHTRACMVCIPSYVNIWRATMDDDGHVNRLDDVIQEAYNRWVHKLNCPGKNKSHCKNLDRTQCKVFEICLHSLLTLTFPCLIQKHNLDFRPKTSSYHEHGNIFQSLSRKKCTKYLCHFKSKLHWN